MLGIHTRTRRFPLQKQQHGLKTTSSVANAVEEIGKQTTIGMVEPSLIGVPSLPVAARRGHKTQPAKAPRQRGTCP